MDGIIGLLIILGATGGVIGGIYTRRWIKDIEDITDIKFSTRRATLIYLKYVVGGITFLIWIWPYIIYRSMKLIYIWIRNLILDK